MGTFATGIVVMGQFSNLLGRNHRDRTISLQSFIYSLHFQQASGGIQALGKPDHTSELASVQIGVDMAMYVSPFST